MWDHDSMGSRLSSTVLDRLKYDTGLAGIPEVLPSPSTGNQRYPADTAGEPLGHSSCLTSSAAALKSKTKQKTPTYRACHEVIDWKKQSQRHRKCAGTVLKYNFSTTSPQSKTFPKPHGAAADPSLLTLLLLPPAVVPKVCYVVVLHAPLHVLQVRARVLLGKALGHVVGDFQVLCDPPVCVTHRPGAGTRAQQCGTRFKGAAKPPAPVM